MTAPEPRPPAQPPVTVDVMLAPRHRFALAMGALANVVMLVAVAAGHAVRPLLIIVLALDAIEFVSALAGWRLKGRLR